MDMEGNTSAVEPNRVKSSGIIGNRNQNVASVIASEGTEDVLWILEVNNQVATLVCLRGGVTNESP